MQTDTNVNSDGAEKDRKGDYVCFEPPSNFVVPTQEDPEKPLTLVCDFKVLPGPKLEMTRLGDTPMPEEDKDKDKKSKSEKRPNYDDEAKAMTSGMATTGLGGGDGGAGY